MVYDTIVTTVVLIMPLQKFPRIHRFTLTQEIHRAIFGLEQACFLIRTNQDVKRNFNYADVYISMVRSNLRLCYDLEIVGEGAYLHSQKLLGEVGKLLGAWRKRFSF